MVIKEGKILFGRDLHKGDVFAIPGGHWENGETLKECAKREVREESGVECDHLSLVGVYDFYREDKQRSYVSICMKADYVSGNPRSQVEEGRVEWDWYAPEEALKLNLFPPDRIFVQRYLSGVIFE